MTSDLRCHRPTPRAFVAIVFAAAAGALGGCNPNPVGAYSVQCTVRLDRAGATGDPAETPEAQRTVNASFRVESRPGAAGQEFEILGDPCTMRIEPSPRSGPPWSRRVVFHVRFGSCGIDFPRVAERRLSLGTDGMGIYGGGRMSFDLAGEVYPDGVRQIVGVQCHATKR